MNEDIENVVGIMNKLIARDGGKLSLAAYDQGRGIVEVNFMPSANANCETCSFTPEMIQAFLEESLRSHGIQAESVIVSEVPAS
jgi:Fe-S cluster biogenesis protein NfuA